MSSNNSGSNTTKNIVCLHPKNERVQDEEKVVQHPQILVRNAGIGEEVNTGANNRIILTIENVLNAILLNPLQ